MATEIATFEKQKVASYLKICQKIDELIGQKTVIESEMEAHVRDTGEMTLCNLIEVSFSKNPPKFVSNTEGGKVTDSMRKTLLDSLSDTDFVKTTTGLQNKLIHEAKDTNKVLKTALKKSGLDTEQTDKMSFNKLVKSGKK